MYWKDEFARMILSGQLKSYTDYSDAMTKFPSLRVKTIDANGRVVVVQFTGKGDWMKPLEWANNHVASLRARYIDSRSRLDDVGSDPSVICSSACREVIELKNQLGSDPALIEQLRTQLDRANDNYIRAMMLAKTLNNRMDISPNDHDKLKAFDPQRPRYIL